MQPNLFLPCGNKHTGSRGDMAGSCEDDTAKQEAPQQIRRKFKLPESGQPLAETERRGIEGVAGKIAKEREVAQDVFQPLLSLHLLRS